MQDQHMLRLILTLCIGYAGAHIATRLKVSAGAMIGAMLAVSILGSLTELPFFLEEGKIAAQIIAGAFIGSGMDRDSVLGLKSMIWPALFMMAGLLAVNWIMGIFLYFTTPLDLASALFATTPGGIAEMTIISHDMGADTSSVVIFQIARLLSAIGLLPIIITRLVKRLSKTYYSECSATQLPEAPSELLGEQTKPDAPIHSARTVLITVALATFGGILGKLSGLPAGILIFSMFSTSILKIKTGIGFIPVKLKRTAQVLSGIFIGCNMSPDVLKHLTKYLLPLCGMVTGYIFLCILLGFILHKVFKLDLATALFCCTPAGASDMSLISSELGAAGAQVALLQLVRIVGVISLFPAVISLVT